MNRQIKVHVGAGTPARASGCAFGRSGVAVRRTDRSGRSDAAARCLAELAASPAAAVAGLRAVAEAERPFSMAPDGKATFISTTYNTQRHNTTAIRPALCLNLARGASATGSRTCSTHFRKTASLWPGQARPGHPLACCSTQMWRMCAVVDADHHALAHAWVRIAREAVGPAPNSPAAVVGPITSTQPTATLTCTGKPLGEALCFDVTLASPLTREGRPQPRASLCCLSR